jgi:predicted RNase H-like HicB family nuclease
MRLRVLIDYDKQTGSYSAVCPELPGCASAGETEEEALGNIREAIELYLQPDDLEPGPTTKVYTLAV